MALLLLLHSLSFLWHRYSPFALIVDLPFSVDSLGIVRLICCTCVTEESASNRPDRQARRTQFIDMCCFITPQIKFGKAASAVMYYKTQMGGRQEEERQIRGSRRRCQCLPTAMRRIEPVWRATVDTGTCGNRQGLAQDQYPQKDWFYKFYLQWISCSYFLTYMAVSVQS